MSSDVPLTILSLLSPAAAELLATPSGPAVGFPDLMAVLVGLAAAGQGQGHVILFKAVLEWLQVSLSFYDLGFLIYYNTENYILFP